MKGDRKILLFDSKELDTIRNRHSRLSKRLIIHVPPLLSLNYQFPRTFLHFSTQTTIQRKEKEKWKKKKKALIDSLLSFFPSCPLPRSVSTFTLLSREPFSVARYHGPIKFFYPRLVEDDFAE